MGYLGVGDWVRLGGSCIGTTQDDCYPPPQHNGLHEVRCWRQIASFCTIQKEQQTPRFKRLAAICNFSVTGRLSLPRHYAYNLPFLLSAMADSVKDQVRRSGYTTLRQ